MDRNTPDRNSVARPQHNHNTRSHGHTQMDLPLWTRQVPLLQPRDRRIRTCKADGSFNTHTAYLALSTLRLRARRRTLVEDISRFLGRNMDDWYAALHRPKDLPENALDWSTVLLELTYDLASSMAGYQRLEQVFQAVKDTAPNPEVSGRVQAALDARNTEQISPESTEIQRLKYEVKTLQQQLADSEFSYGLLEELQKDDPENVSDEEGTIVAPEEQRNRDSSGELPLQAAPGLLPPKIVASMASDLPDELQHLRVINKPEDTSAVERRMANSAADVYTWLHGNSAPQDEMRNLEDRHLQDVADNVLLRRKLRQTQRQLQRTQRKVDRFDRDDLITESEESNNDLEPYVDPSPCHSAVSSELTVTDANGETTEAAKEPVAEVSTLPYRPNPSSRPVCNCNWPARGPNKCLRHNAFPSEIPGHLRVGGVYPTPPYRPNATAHTGCIFYPDRCRCRVPCPLSWYPPLPNHSSLSSEISEEP